MLKILGCIVSEHDLTLVAVSALICALGSFTTTTILGHRMIKGVGLSASSVTFAAIVFGSSVWSLHFIAMMAFLPAEMIAYDLSLTALSAVVAVAGSSLAFQWWRLKVRTLPRVAGSGIFLGLTIAAMHYTGVAAMRVSVGAIFDQLFVAASLVIGCVFSVVALGRLAPESGVARRIEVAIWLSLAICGLHFTGMTAVTVVPGRAEPAGAVVLGSTTVAVAVGCVSVAILVASLVATVVERYISRIRHVARHDPLTGLANRLALMERLDVLLSLAAQQRSRFAVVFIDLDRFKPINDLHGHAIGDAVLVETSRRLHAVLPRSDTLARIGGDEFVMLAMTDPKPDAVAAVAGRAIGSLRRPLEVEGHRLAVGASVGVAFFPDDGHTADALLRAADVAMYRAKSDGRGTIRFYERAMNAQLQTNLKLEQELNSALDDDELVLHYQPIVNGRTGAVETFEALVRWNHPRRGLISPADFIPLAERSGLIERIGKWVIETACRDAAGWQHPWRVAFNVSPRQFQRSNVCEQIAEALHRTGLPAQRLVVEVTESILIEDTATAVATLNRLRQLGIRIALDDFGTGYSSLSYLQLFRFDKFKIDKSFVRRLGECDDAVTITRTIVNLGHNLGLHVTAEGVETLDQLAVLRSLGCDQIQGYLIARPGPLGSWTENDRLRTLALFQPERALIPT